MRFCLLALAPCVSVLAGHAQTSKADDSGFVRVMTQRRGEQVYVNGRAIGAPPIQDSIAVPAGVCVVKLGQTVRYCTVPPQRLVEVDLDLPEKRIDKNALWWTLGGACAAGCLGVIAFAVWPLIQAL